MSSQVQKIPTQRKEDILHHQLTTLPGQNTDQDMKTEIVPLQDLITPTTGTHPKTDLLHHTDHTKDPPHIPGITQGTTMVTATTTGLTITDLHQETDLNPTQEMTDLAVQMNLILKKSPFLTRTNPFSSQWLKTII